MKVSCRIVRHRSLANFERFIVPNRSRRGEILESPRAGRYNSLIEALATFREVHYGWAMEYINKWVTDARGTGGTPYLKWLNQLIDETRAHALPERSS